MASQRPKENQRLPKETQKERNAPHNKKNKKDIELFRYENTHFTMTHFPICELFLKWIDKFGTEEDLKVLDNFLHHSNMYTPTEQFEKGIRYRLKNIKQSA